jgi:gas vesicle protein
MENDNLNSYRNDSSNFGFALGLLAGTAVGAGLIMFFAPRAVSEVRERLTTSARSLGAHASNQYQQASARVADTVNEATRTGQQVRDEVAEAVARGAREVERFASASKT